MCCSCTAFSPAQETILSSFQHLMAPLELLGVALTAPSVPGPLSTAIAPQAITLLRATRFSLPPPPSPDAAGRDTGGMCSPRCHTSSGFLAAVPAQKSLSCQVTGCDDGAAGKNFKTAQTIRDCLRRMGSKIGSLD